MASFRFPRGTDNAIRQLYADLDRFDFIHSVPTHLDLPFVILIQNQNLSKLKTKLDEFFRQHPVIVNEIKNHFYNGFIIYILKRMFDPLFTQDDVARTNRLINKFFNNSEHRKNIKIIFDFFFDELKPLIWNIMDSPWKSAYEYIDAIPNYLVWRFTISYLEKSGASALTSLMYLNQMDLVQTQDENLPKTPAEYKRKCFLLSIFFMVLCIIFRSEIFRFMLYYVVGLICTASAVIIWWIS